MLVATGVQLGRRAVALVLSLCTVLAGLVAHSHEASVAHVREQLTGALAHAHELAEAHAHDATPHLHGRDVEAHAEAGGCALLAALDHATALAHPPAAAVDAPRALDVASPELAVGPPVTLALYRLAPKTSPPTHA